MQARRAAAGGAARDAALDRPKGGRVMNIFHKGLVLCCLPLLLVGANAVGGLNGIDVTIANDGTEDVVVTVYDTSTQPNSVVLSHERINGFTKIPVSLAADETGRANVAWTAVTVDPRSRKCGHASTVGLTDSASVTVHADAKCASS
jgi:hypothetical protein